MSGRELLEYGAATADGERRWNDYVYFHCARRGWWMSYDELDVDEMTPQVHLNLLAEFTWREVKEVLMTKSLIVAGVMSGR